MKNLFIILFLFFTGNALAQSSDNKPKVFNVRLFGLTGDSTQDATPGIQAAVNAASAAGGGTVFFPNGFYWLNGARVTSGDNPNSQIVIPATTFQSNARTNIAFVGETRPNYTPALRTTDQKYPRNGVIIKSTITGSGSMPAVFGGLGSGGGENATYVSFDNLAILVPSNAGGTGPTMSAINGYLWPSVEVNHCVIGIDTSLLKDTIPVTETAGIITAKTLGEPMSRISNTVVYGFRYGVIAGEHTILDKVYPHSCYAGVVPQKSAHSIRGTILSQWNYIDVLIPNSSIMQGVIPPYTGTPINIDLDVEKYNGNTPSKWYNNVYTFADSGSRAIGKLFYFMANATTYTKYGGTNANFIDYALDSGYANGSNYQIQFALNRYLSSSSNFTFNSSTNALTLGGTLSTTGNISTTGNYTATNNSATSNAGISLTNTNSGSSANETVKVINDAGTVGGMTVYSSAASGTLSNTVSLSGTNSIRIASASNSATGGLFPVHISAGGYDNIRATFFSNGGVGINETTDSTSVKFNVNGTGLMSTLYGSVASAGNLGLASTTHATKGFITFGTSAYDETNNRLGIGTAAPSYDLHVSKTLNGNVALRVTNLSTGTAGAAPIYSANSNAFGGFYKFSTGGTTYKTIVASDLAFYNSVTAGNISFLNDYTSGNINFSAGGSSTAQMTIASTGIVTYTGTISPRAGTATASTAPLKFTSGTNLTTAEAGAMEYNGTNLFFSPSTTRYTVDLSLTGSATLDFPSTLLTAVADLTITVTGAADGDVVVLGVPNGSVTATAQYTAWVSAANTVTVRFSPKATEDPASGTFKVRVLKP